MAETDTLRRLQETLEMLIDRDSDLRTMQDAMVRMCHVQYEPPPSLAALTWIRIFRSTAPYNAIQAGRRVLGNLSERLELAPLSKTQAERRRVNQWEKVLQWQFDLAVSRRPTVRQDIYGSGLQFGEIIGNVIHIPTQLEALKKIGGSPSPMRRSAMLRYGDYAISVKSPLNVHTMYSDYMLEGAYYVAVKTAQEIVNFWGTEAAGINAMILEDPKYAETPYVLVDADTYDGRIVACAPGETESTDIIGRLEIIMEEEERSYPFLPWFGAIGGTELESAPDHARLPLLYPVYRSEQWLTTNLVGTLLASQSIAEFGKPGVKVMGPDPNRVKARYGQPGGRWNVPTLHDVLPMQKDGLDPALQALYMQFLGEMEGSTLPKVLQSVETNSNETYSGFNLKVATAMGALTPFKAMGESAIADAYKLMLLWSHYTGHDIRGYDTTAFRQRGTPYEIDSAKIDPERLYLAVKARPDLPIDKQQQANTAMLLSKSMKISPASLITDMGYTDAEGEMDDYERNLIKDTVLAAKLERLKMEASGEMQNMIMEQAQQLAQQMVEEQMQGPPEGAEMPPEEGPGLEEPPPGAPMGVEGAEGPGVNPNMGGEPAAAMNPSGASYEGSTGMTRGGEEVAAAGGI